MSVEIRKFADLAVEQWRNGGGVTRTVAASRSGEPDAGPHWRVSLADITADGDFSVFPGMQRYLVLVDGPALWLTVDGVERRLSRPEVVSFDGGARTSCRVDAPTRDLNVMVRRGCAEASVSLTETDSVVLGSSSTSSSFVVVLEGSLEVRDSAAGTVTGDAGRLDCVCVLNGATCEISGAGLAALIQIVAVGNQRIRSSGVVLREAVPPPRPGGPVDPTR